MKWDTITRGAAALLGVVLGLLGGWDVPLRILVAFMAADYLTGLGVALARRSGKTPGGGLSSAVGLKGLLKKGLMLAVVLVAAQLDLLTGAAAVRQGACFFFIANEGLSILENAELLGVPLPGFLTRALEGLGRGSSDV